MFEDEPRGITAAHNCTMMAIGLIGAHPAYVNLAPINIEILQLKITAYTEVEIRGCTRRYDLVQADLAVASFNELSVINLRRLFANKGSTFMDLQKQIIEKSPPKRKLTIDTIF